MRHVLPADHSRPQWYVFDNLGIMSTNRAEFAEVVNAVRDHTALLLGTTIGYDDDDWAAPTGLAGWTRSHVAAHLAEGANGLVRVITGLEAGIPTRMYDSQSAKHHAIELGALTGGLQLQIRLDTSASQLQDHFARLEGDTRPVALRAGYRIPAHQIPLARLGEVVLHHTDLGSQFSTADLTPEIAVELLAFHIDRIGRRDDFPPLRLVADEGYEGCVGRSGIPTQMNGPAGDLVAWLARGTESSRIYRSQPSDS